MTEEDRKNIERIEDETGCWVDRNIYDPKRGGFSIEGDDDFYECLPADETLFKTEAGGDSIDTIKCVRCGGVEFNVGKAYYHTSVRCMKCEWECCVHNG